jgi:hypothetical protein
MEFFGLGFRPRRIVFQYTLTSRLDGWLWVGASACAGFPSWMSVLDHSFFLRFLFFWTTIWTTDICYEHHVYGLLRWMLMIKHTYLQSFNVIS